jgi:hypothetical protein
MDKDKDCTLEYKMDLDDIKRIIQEETTGVRTAGWISSSPPDRRNAIEWGLKIQQLEILQDIGNALSDIRSAIYDVNGDVTFQ